ncbi:MAG: SpoIIE family protein phosphatase [Lentisphaeraceae bacterium]|nr:SpoIIE family protein phosphatase [Lentisphaeraceae bacterium]
MTSEVKHKILVIDDHVVMREIVKDILMDQGYDVVILEGTEGAKEILDTQKISLLLLDVQMPNETGYEFLKRLKKENGRLDVPVIFMTGMDNIDDKVYGFELGAVDYIVKPFHRMDVLMRVKAHLKLVETHNEQKEKLQQLNEAHLAHLKQPKDLPKARFGVYYKSFQEAGGDFYDVFSLEKKDCYAYFIADISGHDIGTSYVMPAVQALLNEVIKTGDTLEAKMNKFNKSVLDILPEGKFITAQLLMVDRRAGKADIVNMGHTPFLHLSGEGTVKEMELPGDVLGVFEEAEFGFASFKIESYDKFIMYSDGLIENPDERRIWTDGMKMLRSATQKHFDSDVRDLGIELVQELLGEQQPKDDVVVLTIEV